MPQARSRVWNAFWLSAITPLMLTSPTDAHAQEQESVAIVFDGSNSMWGQVDGRPKIEIAREALSDFVADWPETADLGLVAFGHRREADCGDIETLQPIGPARPLKFVLAVGGITPHGKSPISAAVRQAAEALAYQDNPATVVLFSDGVETCGADPCALAAELEQAGIRFTAHVVGFDVEGDENQLICLAEATGGLYLSAANAPELTEALSAVRSIAAEPEAEGRITLEAVDADTGEVLETGVIWRVVSLETEERAPIRAGVSRPALPLAPGGYLVEAQAGAAVGRIEIDVVEGEAAAHQVSLAVSEAAAAAAVLGPIIEQENNDSFGAATRIAIAPEAAPRPQGRSFGDAIPIAVKGRFAGAMESGGRTWRRVTVDDQGALTIGLVTVPAGARIALRIWNADRSTLTSWFDFATGEALFDLPAPGVYALEVALSDAGGDFAMDLAFSPTGDAFEPNDSFGRAADISLEGPLAAAVLPRGDADWLRFIAPDQGALSVSLTAPAPAGVEPSLRLWNADRSALTGWLRTRRGEPAVFDLAAPGPYVLELRDSGNDGRSPELLALHTAFAPTRDLGEPDNSFGAARGVEVNADLVGTIFPRKDADWMRFTVADQGALTLTLTQAPEAIQPSVRLWSRERSALSGWSPLASTPVFDLPAAGDYWLEIRDAGDDGRATDPYHIAAAFAPTGEAGEPNNRFAQAAPFNPGESIEGAILPRGDADWRSFEIPARGALTLTLAKRPAEIAPVVRFWNAEASAISSWTSLLDGPLVFDLPRRGVYRLEIRDAGDDGRSPDPYRIDTAFAPAVVTEPAGEGVFHGVLFPLGDADWFRLTATTEGEITLTLIETPDGVEPVARLWNAERSAITGWLPLLANGAPASASATLPAAGDYLIEIRDGGGDGRAEAPYRFSVTWPGLDDARP